MSDLDMKIIKCTEHSSNSAWTEIGEKNAHSILTLQGKSRRIPKPSAKQLQWKEGPQEFTVGDKKLLSDKIEDQPQQIFDFLVPIFHLMRTEIEQQSNDQTELVESIVRNLDAKVHELHEDYVKRVAPFPHSLNVLGIRMDKLMDRFDHQIQIQKYHETQQVYLRDNLAKNLENQQQIIGCFDEIRMTNGYNPTPIPGNGPITAHPELEALRQEVATLRANIPLMANTNSESPPPPHTPIPSSPRPWSQPW